MPKDFIDPTIRWIDPKTGAVTKEMTPDEFRQRYQGREEDESHPKPNGHRLRGKAAHLTEREQARIRELAKSKTVRQIADEMGVTRKTVYTHLKGTR